MSSIDLVVVNYKTYGLVGQFLYSYRKFQPSCDARMILVDNSSDPSQLDALDKTGVDEVIVFQDNAGYAKACNAGAAAFGDSEYIGLFNSDTEFVDDRCVDQCVEYLEDNPDVGVVGPFQYSSDGKITHGGILGTHSKPEHRGWLKNRSDEYRDNIEAVTVSGSAYFTRRSLWNELEQCPIYSDMFPDVTGAFPPFFHFYEETLYSYHAFGHGYKCVYLGEAEMIHQWHKSSPVGSQDKNFKEGRVRFREFCDAHGIAHD